MKQKVKNLSIENARITYKNFSGAASQFNKEGERNFAVVLDQDLALQLQAEGWNVKFPKPDERWENPEEDPRTPTLPVEVSYKAIPPKVIVINGEGGVKTRLGEAEVGTLDWAQIERIDLVINPYLWEVNGKSGIKAYLGAIYVTIVSDPFVERYGI